ncbi:eukaryotic translation initiation factor 3 subunit J [Polychytrium aggregatum]|uniref:eukaryotic translation initiation factor 3 subunit J n=1 Tax=Polychytrium aggregatum TaxID=110093 RepID=UPI0022FEB502|nr:eukaryotic translation initiation factor 3 subunit J [Polychytrium aggregatum]KAI9205728.1 eukaryotic translation initiation factor 3 subunit J [Polychytrium aggregatum]
MSDWENEDEDVQVAIPVPSAANRWDDEDAEEEDVKDSWEDDEEELKKKKKKEEEERLKKEAEAKKAAAAPKKKTLAQTLKEKEEDEKRKRLAKAAELAISNETEAEKRERERREIVQADFENAKELFSSIAPSPNVPSDSVLETLKPSNRAEFDAYNKELQTKFTSFEKSAHYAYFAENVVRDMCVSLSVDDLKKVAALLNAMASEKLKAQKEKDKKGKKGGKAKVSLKATPGGIDTTNYDDAYDEYEDFM